MTQNSIADNRMVWLDVVRCVAMLMVISVHCIDPFYISPTMRVIPEYTLGSHLRFASPSFGSLIRNDDRITAATGQATAFRHFL